MASLAARLTGENHSCQALRFGTLRKPMAAATLIASRLFKKVKVDLFEQPLKVFELPFQHSTIQDSNFT